LGETKRERKKGADAKGQASDEGAEGRVVGAGGRKLGQGVGEEGTAKVFRRGKEIALG